VNKNSFVHRLTKVLIDIMFFGGIICCAALPFIMSPLSEFLGYERDTVALNTIVLTLSGLCALFILWQLKAMFRTLLGGDPFTPQNTSCFRRCAMAGFLIALIYIVKIVLRFTVASAVIAVIFALLGLFSLTLKDVFKQAVAYKEENEWTV